MKQRDEVEPVAKRQDFSKSQEFVRSDDLNKQNLLRDNSVPPPSRKIDSEKFGQITSSDRKAMREEKRNQEL